MKEIKSIIFLGSAQAKKPEIIIRTFYETMNRNPERDILLTNSPEGNVPQFAKSLGLSIIICKDVHFSDEGWIKASLAELSEGVLVSCGWPYKIPNAVINAFSASINCHGSYLPDYRGSRAYMHYWANCSEFFGASIHYLTDRFDDGNVLVRGKLQMFNDESHDSVFVRTAELCGHLLPAALMEIEQENAGFVAAGQKRYFYQMSPDEFEEHRRINDQRISEGKGPLLTRHKALE